MINKKPLLEKRNKQMNQPERANDLTVIKDKQFNKPFGKPDQGAEYERKAF